MTRNTPKSTLGELLTRHKNFADSANFTVPIDLSARDPLFLPPRFLWAQHALNASELRRLLG